MEGTKGDSRAGPRLIAVIVGFVIGEIAGERSEIVARLVLYLWSPHSLQEHAVFEARLVVLFLFAMISTWLGVRLVQRGWIELQEVVLGLVGAMLVAVFAVLDLVLPVAAPEDLAGNARYFYFIVWAVVLLIMPILRGAWRNSDERASDVEGNFLAVICGSAAVAFVAGYVVRLLPLWLVHLAPGLVPWLGVGSGSSFGAGYFRSWEDWIVSPATLDPIACAVFVAMFAPWLFARSWGLSPGAGRLWAALYAAFAILFTGYYGSGIYLPDSGGWTKNLPAGDVSESLFIGFAAYAFVFVLGSAAWLWKAPANAWLRHAALAGGIGVAFGLVSWAFLGSLIVAAGASSGQRLLFALAHGVNGIVLGLLVSFTAAVAGRRDAVDAPLSVSPARQPRQRPSGGHHQRRRAH